MTPEEKATMEQHLKRLKAKRSPLKGAITRAEASATDFASGKAATEGELCARRESIVNR